MWYQKDTCGTESFAKSMYGVIKDVDEELAAKK
jgi:hypothetical protein